MPFSLRTALSWSCLSMTYEESRQNKTCDSKTTRDEKRREEYTYTYIRIRRRLTLYVPENLIPTFRQLQDILKREGSSLSKWVRQNAISYVRLHEPGNPQQRIDVILKNGQAYKALPLCSCGALATRKVHLTSNESVFCCSRHMPKRNVKFFKELKK